MHTDQMENPAMSSLDEPIASLLNLVKRHYLISIVLHRITIKSHNGGTCLNKEPTTNKSLLVFIAGVIVQEIQKRYVDPASETMLLIFRYTCTC